MHLEIGGESLDRTRTFYSELFGWDIRIDEKHLERSDELGGSKIIGPMRVGRVGAVAMFADPDRNIVGLFSG